MSKNFEVLQQSHEQDLFRTPSSPAGPAVAAIRRPIPARGEEFPQKVLKGISLPIHWLDLIKEGARNWREKALRRNNHGRADLETIAREEEVKLVQRVFRAGNGQSPQVVLFSGVEAGAGCASICARTSEILAAQPEASVCVVDANFRSPCLHQYFGMENARGLAEAVRESGPITDFAHQVPERNLWVMPSGLGSDHLSIALVSDRLRTRMTELRATFKHVVINSSPMGLDTDSIELSRWTDGVVLVVEANSTRRDAARRVKENLEVADVRMLGVVLNNRTFPIPDALYSRL